MKYNNIGDYLKYEFMTKYGINQNMLAVAIKVEQNRISEIIRHRRRITPNTDLRLCKFFKQKDGHFLDIQKEIELKSEKKAISSLLKEINTIEIFSQN